VQLARAMTSNPVTVGSRDSLVMAKDLMAAGSFRRLPVVDGGRLVGILTERDIREHLVSAFGAYPCRRRNAHSGHHSHAGR
jgi:CBS domain-containing protein